MDATFWALIALVLFIGVVPMNQSSTEKNG